MSDEYKFGEAIEVFIHDAWRPGVYIGRNPTNGNLHVAYQAHFMKNGAEPDWVELVKVRRRPVTLQQPPAKGPAPDDAAVIWDIVRKHLGSPSVVGIGAQLVTALGKLKAAK